MFIRKGVPYKNRNTLSILCLLQSVYNNCISSTMLLGNDFELYTTILLTTFCSSVISNRIR